MPIEQRMTPQDYKKICRILEIDGCYFVNQEGSHLKYRKEQKEGRTLTITVTRYKSIPVEVIKSILHQAKMSREKYFELLNKA
jgi:predicted RNA binding protein YcfA (HicA-like mRNA interferase family)